MPQDTAEAQAATQIASIVAMVAALTVDYDRLEELRDERAELTREYQSLASNAHATNAERDDAAKNLREWAEANAEELAELEAASGGNASEEEAREAIRQDALSVELRSGWARSKEEFEPEEFRIVLCTGGPHVELVGDLDRGTPSRIRVLCRGWGTSGEYFPSSEESKALTTYCAQFYFGE